MTDDPANEANDDDLPVSELEIVAALVLVRRLTGIRVARPDEHYAESQDHWRVEFRRAFETHHAAQTAAYYNRKLNGG